MFNRGKRETDKSEKSLLRIAALLSTGLALGYVLLSRLDMVMPITQLPEVLCVPSCQPTSTAHKAIEPGLKLNADKPLSALLSAEVEKESVSLLVEKSQHRVVLFYNKEPIKSYEAVFGTVPTGDKRMEGDRKTPEGIFRIRDLYPHEQWSKFLWLDYPTLQSWRRHFRAKLSREISPLATIGSQIGIHGAPAGVDERLVEERDNWTWGCISLKNSDVDEIYDFVTRGSIVEIIP